MNRKTILYISLILILLPVVLAYDFPDNFQSILDIYRNFDFSLFYDNYFAIIDFAVYFFFFLGAAKTTLESRFPGRGGTAVITSLAFVLSFSLAITETQMGFNLRSFGPLAGTVFVGIITVFIYHILNHAVLSKTLSASLAYILMYFSLQAVSPGIFDWFEAKVPLLNFLLFIAFIFSIIRAIAAIWPHKKIKEVSEKLKPYLSGREGILPREKLEQEERVLKKNVLKPIKKEIHDAKVLKKEIKTLMRFIKRNKENPDLYQSVNNMLNKMLPEQVDIEEKLTNIIRMNQSIKSFDLNIFNELKRKFGSKIPPQIKKEIENYIKEEYKKLKIETRIEQLEKEIGNHYHAFKGTMAESVTLLGQKNISAAIEHFENSFEHLDNIEDGFKEIKSLERKIRKLTKIEIHEFEDFLKKTF